MPWRRTVAVSGTVDRLRLVSLIGCGGQYGRGVAAGLGGPGRVKLTVGSYCAINWPWTTH